MTFLNDPVKMLIYCKRGSSFNPLFYFPLFFFLLPLCIFIFYSWLLNAAILHETTIKIEKNIHECGWKQCFHIHKVSLLALVYIVPVL